MLAGELRSDPKADLRAVALAVIERELDAATGREGRAFVQALGSCEGAVRPLLARRARQTDAVGTDAAMLLLESGHYRGPNPTRYRADENGGLRALAARETEHDDDARRRYFVDPDERVRRAALRAALRAQDETDIPRLLEVARLDPDVVTRGLALGTLGAMGNEEVVSRLWDRYELADEPTRLGIVDAFAGEALLARGGRDKLAFLVDTTDGFVALHAAYLLDRLSTAVKDKGATRLLRFAKEGTSDERRLALRWLDPGGEDVEAALLEATTDDDPSVAIIGWARLLRSPNHRAKAEDGLLELAAGPDASRYEALSALAAGGSARVLPQLEELLLAEDARTRKVAGLGLVRLGEERRAAVLLADDSAPVRQAIACRLLASER